MPGSSLWIGGMLECWNVGLTGGVFAVPEVFLSPWEKT